MLISVNYSFSYKNKELFEFLKKAAYDTDLDVPKETITLTKTEKDGILSNEDELPSVFSKEKKHDDNPNIKDDSVISISDDDVSSRFSFKSLDDNSEDPKSGEEEKENTENNENKKDETNVDDNKEEKQEEKVENEEKKADEDDEVIPDQAVQVETTSETVSLEKNTDNQDNTVMKNREKPVENEPIYRPPMRKSAVSSDNKENYNKEVLRLLKNIQKRLINESYYRKRNDLLSKLRKTKTPLITESKNLHDHKKDDVFEYSSSLKNKKKNKTKSKMLSFSSKN